METPSGKENASVIYGHGLEDVDGSTTTTTSNSRALVARGPTALTLASSHPKHGALLPSSSKGKRVPTLFLGEFQAPLFLDFRYVAVGQSKTLEFAMKVMDAATKDVNIKVDKEPKGFKVAFDGTNSWGYLTWSPIKEGPTREVILLKMNNRHRLQITALGQALGSSLPTKTSKSSTALVDPKAMMPSTPRAPLRTFPVNCLPGSRPEATAPVKAIAPSSDLSSVRTRLDNLGDRLGSLLEGGSELTSMTLTPAPGGKGHMSLAPARSVPSTPKAPPNTTGGASMSIRSSKPTPARLEGPAPSLGTTAATARSNARGTPAVPSFRQEQMLTEWLNFTFFPPDVTPTIAHAADIFRAQEDAVRKRAEVLYASEELAMARTRVQAEIARGRLAIRDDEDLYADLNLRENFVTLLLSYQLPWLQVGLEVVLGLELSRSRVARTREGETVRVSTLDVLRKTIVQRILNDPEIARRHAGRCAVPSGRFGQNYRKELRTHTLQRFLALVHFLDRAKRDEILPRKRTLFKPSAGIKSSADLLARFNRDNLSAEGNLVKHLAALGLTVSYAQTYVDEFDFRTTCLARDLRDGVRLSRLVDLLLSGKAVCPSLRVPAVSRLQKIYNVRLALDKLGQAGVWDRNAVITAEDIVDGNREKTISALLQVVKHFNLDFVVVSLRGITMLQAHIRRRVMQRRYSRLQSLALNLQRLYRTHRVYFRCRSFHVPAVLALQRRWRAIQSRRELLYLDQQATRIKSHWRGYVIRIRFIAARKAIVHIQRAIRAALYRAERVRLDKSAIMIQKAFRGYQTRRDLYHQSLAATSIQASWRVWCSRQSYLRLRAATVAIQRFVRGLLARRAASLRRRSVLCIQRAVQKRHAAKTHWAITLQRLFRGRYVRQQAKAQHQAALHIQRVFKGSMQRRSYQISIMTLTRLQAWTRTCLHQRAYNRTRFSLLVLQRSFREALQRRRYHQHAAARDIQKCWRRYTALSHWYQVRVSAVRLQAMARSRHAQRTYQKGRSQVISLQSRVRCLLSSRRYRRLHQSTVLMQRLWRGHVARQQIRHLHSQAIVLQRRWRGVVVRYNSCQIAVASVKIQSAFRAYARKKSYRGYRSALITLQACFRGRSVRHHLQLCHTSATNVQRAWRCWAARRKYCNFLSKVVLVQSCVRALITLDRYHHSRQAAGILQRSFRCYLARSRLQREWAARTIQRLYRGHMCRRHIQWLNYCTTLIQKAYRRHHQRQIFLSLVAATVHLQALARQRSCRRTFHSAIRRTIIIQSLWRGALVRQELARVEDAARRLQACWRCYKLRGRYVACRQGWVQCQAAIRAFTTRRRFLRCRSAAMSLQRAWRAQMRHRWVKKWALCVAVQSRWRGRKIRLHLAQEHQAATVVQVAWRQWTNRQSYLLLRRQIIRAQALIRMYLISRQYRRMCAAATVVQCRRRGQLVRRRQHAEASAATTMAAAWRSYVIRRQYKKAYDQLVLAQSLARSFLDRRRYLAFRNALIVLQQSSRCMLMERQRCMVRLAQEVQRLYRGHRVRNHLLTLHGHATTLQAAWRRWQCQACYKRYIGALVILQSCARCKPLRASFLLHRHSALTIQRYWRGYQTRQALVTFHAAAIEIQRIWRGHAAIRSFTIAVRAVITLQSQARCLASRRRYRRRLLALVALQRQVRLHLLERRIQAHRASVIYVQSLWRKRAQRQRYLRVQWAIVKVQAQARGHLCRARMGRFLGAIIHMQACYRGWHVRRRCGHKLRALRHKVEEAHKKALADPTLCIGYRHSIALEILLTSKSCSQIIKCCETLEVSTRLSQVCCEALVAARGIQKLASLIRSCNRSKPHMELLRHVLHVLQNVAAYDHMVLYVSRCEGLTETLVELLQHHQYKDLTFMPAALLLLRLKRADEDVQACLEVPENARRLQGVLRLLERKAEQERALKSTRYKKVDDKDVMAMVPLRVLRLLAEAPTSN